MDNKPIKVMVVEDEEMLLEVVTRKLKTVGFDVISCISAKQALEYLKTMQETPDVIWLDYYLEDMNGLDFMRLLRADNNFAKIPVVVVSNSASAEKKDAMLALGAKMYILKAQHRLDEIIDAIKGMLAENKPAVS
jgi:CheY-like chemotaxis protein